VRDAWLLATGTLTAVPVPPPTRVDARTARWAMLLAPLAVAPLGVLAVVLGLLGHLVGLPTPAVAILVLGAVAAGSRALHWDGLSDTVDGLTASYDAERSLAVMRSGTAGPAGVVAVVVVLGAQAAALSALLTTVRGTVLAGALICLSRCALALGCAQGVRGARADGLGATYAGTVPRPAAAASWVAAAVLAGALVGWAGGDWWRGAAAVAAAALVVVALVRRAVSRFGGVTGDVLGAGIELALAALLVSVA
jgi:adenosylcobinamide-GDP ribazoletransferase